VWQWTVGHHALLLRSNPSEVGGSRVEVLFKPAYAVCLQALLPDGLVVEEADAAALTAWEGGGHVGIAGDRDRTLYLVRSGGLLGWVVGGGVSGREDDQDHSGPTMFDGGALRSGVRELFSYNCG